MIRRIARKIRPRKPQAKLKYSYRPRLRPILSADTRAKRRRVLPVPGLGRKIILLAVLGTAGFMLVEKGVWKEVSTRVSGYFAEMKTAPSKAGHAPAAARVRSAGVMKRARNFRTRHFSPAVREERPAAFVKLGELYAIGASGAVLRIPGGAFYDMPVVSGAFFPDKKPGDTLREARLALSIITQAEKNAPGLLKKISEIILNRPEEAQLVFTDNRLTALVGLKDVEKQTANLAAYLDKWDKAKTGTIDMKYGDIAFITEEGEHDE